MHHLPDEAEDVFGVVFAVGVVGDAAAFVGGDLVSIDDPLQGGGSLSGTRRFRVHSGQYRSR